MKLHGKLTRVLVLSSILCLIAAVGFSSLSSAAEVYEVVYEAEGRGSNGLDGRFGTKISDGIEFKKTDPDIREDNVFWGPGVTNAPRGTIYVHYVIKFEAMDGLGNAQKVGNVDVYCGGNGHDHILASQELKVNSVTTPGVYQVYTISFNNQDDHNLQFRIGWSANNNMTVDKIVVSENSTYSLTPPTTTTSETTTTSTSASTTPTTTPPVADFHIELQAEKEPNDNGLSKRPGYGEITEVGWRFDLGEDVVKENVMYGPRLTGVESGEIYVYYVFKVEELAEGASGRVLNLDVYDATSDRQLTELAVMVDDVTVGEYQAFKIKLNNPQNSSLEFRVYWEKTSSFEFDKIVLSNKADAKFDMGVVEDDNGSETSVTDEETTVTDEETTTTNDDKNESPDTGNSVAVGAVVLAVISTGVLLKSKSHKK